MRKTDSTHGQEHRQPYATETRKNKHSRGLEKPGRAYRLLPHDSPTMRTCMPCAETVEWPCRIADACRTGALKHGYGMFIPLPLSFILTVRHLHLPAKTFSPRSADFARYPETPGGFQGYAETWRRFCPRTVPHGRTPRPVRIAW